MANFAAIAGNFVNLVKRTNTSLLENLGPKSEVLANITQEFHAMLRFRAQNIGARIDITCYAEELAVTKFGRSFIVRNTIPSSQEPPANLHFQVVPSHSATIDGYSSATIHADHINMTKFKERNNDYKKIAVQIKRWMKEASQEEACFSKHEMTS